MANTQGSGVVENTVPCEICGKRLESKYNLKAHMKLVHGKGDAEFPCDQCGKSFQPKATLDYPYT